MQLTSSSDVCWALLVGWKTGSLGVLALACLAAAVVLRWLPVAVSVPQFFTQESAVVPVALLFAGALGIAMQGTLVEPSPQVWLLGSGGRRLLRPLRVVLLVALFLVVVAVLAPPHWLPCAVIVMTMAAEAVLCGRWLGLRLAWIAPGVHATASAFLGSRTLVGRSWWAWPADPAPSLLTVAFAAALLAVSLLLEGFRPKVDE